LLAWFTLLGKRVLLEIIAILLLFPPLNNLEKWLGIISLIFVVDHVLNFKVLLNFTVHNGYIFKRIRAFLVFFSQKTRNRIFYFQGLKLLRLRTLNYSQLREPEMRDDRVTFLLNFFYSSWHFCVATWLWNFAVERVGYPLHFFKIDNNVTVWELFSFPGMIIAPVFRFSVNWISCSEAKSGLNSVVRWLEQFLKVEFYFVVFTGLHHSNLLIFSSKNLKELVLGSFDTLFPRISCLLQLQILGFNMVTRVIGLRYPTKSAYSPFLLNLPFHKQLLDSIQFCGIIVAFKASLMICYNYLICWANFLFHFR